MSSALLTQAVETLSPLMFSLVTALLSWLVVTITKKIKSETATDIVDRFGKLATTVVLEVEQTVTSSLRADAADGVLSLEDARNAKRQAMDKLKLYLGEKGQKEALKAFGFSSQAQLDEFISSHIEAAVAKAKATIGTKLKAELGTVIKEPG